MGAPSAMLSFYPDLPKVEGTRACGEFVFLMDRSGSMGSCLSYQDSQPCIEAAKETLLLLLKSLPMGCYFNIYGFGSSYEKFFPESVKYTQKTMEEAVKRVKDLKADLGGTEILTPLLDIYKGPSIPDHPLQFFTKLLEKNAVLHLISLQKANGSWELNKDLTQILGTRLKDMKAANPAKDGDLSAWATVLAVLWLHANGKGLKCEWEILERKAVAWLHDHAECSILRLVQAANRFLKLSVTPDVFFF
ncbi:von Willebrand factor A domain-containing protein 5A-like [Mesocricetus auratus]|uniref:von Willebrand factor A domain-containing protein 5A-like n=1 Tax=Mesocricetus auratus TaxID=10036 RepID=A0ABM2WB53_MESAU|nr:von Willebrand factor A domain-containing protein 5A-like [Mesocricetus auratus]